MNKLYDLFAEVLETPVNEINDDTSPETNENWDSLSAMILVSEIETTFDIKLGAKEIVKMKSVKLVADLLNEKGISF